MPHIPASVKNSSIIPSLASEGKLVHQGKVRDSYKIAGPPKDPDARMIVATDRLSIFDFVLSCLVPHKGEVLTVLPHFWMTQILQEFPNHLVSSPIRTKHHSFAIDLYQWHKDIPLERSLVVKNLNMMKYELIFRRHIGGSVWKEYREHGTAGGQKMPLGLTKWSKLDEPVFTPSTKAEEGHDVNITAARFFGETGELGKKVVAMLKAVYMKAYAFAESKGILILDTKFEVGISESGVPTIADEMLTPDSSRFTTAGDFAQALKDGRDPVFYDKEPIRAWGKTVKTPFMDADGKPITGIDKLDPKNPDHLAFVDSLSVPPEVVVAANTRYLQIAEMLTGLTTNEYVKKYFK